jgi:hypothetical protein
VDFEVEHYRGVLYVRVASDDWPRVRSMLDRDSVALTYPLNIKRKTMFGNLRDVVRHPPW